MTTPVDSLSVEITADTSAFKREIADADKLARGFGNSMSRAFANAVVRGQDLGGVLRTLGMQLSAMALRAAFKPVADGLMSGVSGAFENLMGGGFQGTQAVAPAMSLSGMTPMARGGVIAAPAYFPMPDGRTGLMGERGAEAVVPLTRTADGRLGVATGGGGGGRAAIVMNVTATDAASFRRSEAEVTAMLARAVARGRRGL